MASPAENLDITPALWGGNAPSARALVQLHQSDGTTAKVELPYAVVDGKAIFDGDMVLGSADELARHEEERARNELAFFATSLGDPWPNGVMPWTSDPGCLPIVSAAIAHFGQYTPFRFPRRTGEADYLQFTDAAGSESNIGCSGGAQVVNLGAGASVGIAVHEICHALGLLHEHTRPDRDTFIRVIWQNIDPSNQWIFTKLTPQDGNYNNPYDYNSIMHYPSWAAASQAAPSMLTASGSLIGARNGLSSGDIGGLKSLYPGLPWH